MGSLKNVLLQYFEILPDKGEDVNILFRENEKNFILNFFGPKDSVPYPCLFVYGHTATGKTLLLSQIFKEHNLPYIWIDCHESSNSKVIFKSVVEKLCNDRDYQVKNVNSCELVSFIKKVLKDRTETTYIVLDSAEVLRAENAVVTTFMKLQDLTRTNICIIIISELPWIKFKNTMSSFDPISVHFSNYSKEQIAEILCNECPEEVDKKFYSSYINIILKTFFTVTRNLKELQHQAEVNFEKYCEPLKVDKDFEISNLRLWRNIEPTLKQAMNSVYLREISGAKFKNLCMSVDKPDLIVKKMSTLSDAKYVLTRELPFYSKFLLLASYFASYNQPKTDYKHFVKNQGKQKKKKISRKMEKNRHLLGPKPFPLERMLSIFYAIVEERVSPSAMIFSQISSLVSMGLLLRVTQDDELNCPKYKCLAKLDLVEKIGKTVNLDVMGYLDDFL